jgi:hypothetical protein
MDTISALVGVVVVILAMRLAVKWLHRFNAAEDGWSEWDEPRDWMRPRWALASSGLGVVISDSPWALDCASDVAWLDEDDPTIQAH